MQKNVIELQKDHAGKYSIVAGITAAGAMVVESANAALDPNIATGLTSLQTDFTSLMTLVYPIMISISVALVVFGLVKMFIHKAAGK